MLIQNKEYPDTNQATPSPGLSLPEDVMDNSSDCPDNFSLYMSEVAAYGMLKEDEERELSLHAKAGDQAALKRMVTANLRLVVSVAKHYQGLGLSMEDLVQEGNIGLMIAAKRYKPDKGTRFSTYAVYWIRQSIMRGLSNSSSTVRLPVHMREKISALKKMDKDFQESTGTEPTLEDLAERLGYTPDEVSKLLQIMQPTSSLDIPAGEDGENTIGDLVQDQKTLSPEECYEKQELARLIREILAELPEQERSVLEMRFGLDGGEPMTLQEVGDIFGVTRERIRQIEAKAIRRLKKPSISIKLRDHAK